MAVSLPGRKTFWILQELDDLLQFYLGFFVTGYVRKRDFLFGVLDLAGVAHAKGHRLVVGALHLSQHEPEDENEQEQRQERGRMTPKMYERVDRSLMVIWPS